MIDRHPALIVRARSAEDVRRGVLFAANMTSCCPSKVVATTSLAAPCATADSCSTCRCSRASRSIRRNEWPWRSRASFWASSTRATQAFGLATPLGTVSVTGIAGLTLGGGISWLNGKYGLACDNVIAADVVTADGELLRASATENPDLFWAIRGGSGNFGVVTSFVYQLHPVGPLLTGSLVFPPAQTREALRFYHEFSQSCPDELSTFGSLVTDDDDRTLMSVIYSWCGPLAEGERALRSLRTFGTPVEDIVDVLEYCALQTVIDERLPPGRKHYWKTNFLTDLRDEAIDVMLHFAAERPSPAPVHGVTGPAAPPLACNTCMAPRPGRPDRDGVPASPRPPRLPHPLAVDRSSRRRATHRVDAGVLRGHAPLHRARRVREWTRRRRRRRACVRRMERTIRAWQLSRRTTTRRTSFGPIRTSNPRLVP